MFKVCAMEIHYKIPGVLLAAGANLSGLAQRALCETKPSRQPRGPVVPHFHCLQDTT
jgi:hypothetical protein